MDPELAYLLAEYLARNCSLDIHAHCGAAGAPVQIQAPWEGHHAPGCPQLCPEVDYSNPNQPYFWDHEEMN